MTASKSGDWRAETLGQLRTLILAAAPGIVEEIKWRKPSNPAGVPVWSKDGILCTGETYKTSVKLTFMQGGALPDPAGLFNAVQGGATRRAIDVREGDTINAKALKALVQAAVALNASKGAGKAKAPVRTNEKAVAKTVTKPVKKVAEKAAKK